MFCNSKNNPNEVRPNINICPVCLAHPGTLPVINMEAVKHVLRVGLAVGGNIADYTEFDRKNYFYPDLPKGYQISQFVYPLVNGGILNEVSITRVHLEEDTASSIHDDKAGTTVIDFNRSGVPLMELVTEPTISSAEEAGAFARELQLLLRYLGASDANMEKGEMRVEANISIARNIGVGSPDDHAKVLGTKVEIKNLNSFKSMERAVAYEVERQRSLLVEDRKVVQETRGWDENTQKTFPQRAKEGSADYRYFPDPDLPSLRLSEISEFSADALMDSMPELPAACRNRYRKLGIKSEDAELFVRNRELGNFFESVISAFNNGDREVILAANYIANDLVKIIRDIGKRDSVLRDDIPISKENFTKIINMLSAGNISSRVAKDLLLTSIANRKAPDEIAEKADLLKNTSPAVLESIITVVIEKNEKVVADFRKGKESALEYLVGQSMKALHGAADPMALRNLIRSKL